MIRQLRDGDEKAFQALFDGCTASLQARINRGMSPLLQRKVSVRDVLQEARIAAFELRCDFSGHTADDFRNWLVAIVDHRIRHVVDAYVDTAKRAVNREVSRPHRMDTAHAAGCEPTPSQHAIAAELRDLAEKALQLLSSDHREVIRLSREEGLSLEEIAKRTGRSYEAAKKLRQRATFEYTEIFERLRGENRD